MSALDMTLRARSWEAGISPLTADDEAEVRANWQVYVEAGAVGATPLEIRIDYLRNLQDDHDVSDDNMDACLSCFPASEDFDGIVTTLEDQSGNW